MIRRRPFIAAGALLAAGAMVPSLARAQARVGRVLVGTPPGSQLDLVARLVAEGLREPLGQTFIVENRPGATGRIAIQALKSAEPDGQTLLIVPSGWLTTIPHMRKSTPYDALADFTPLCKACSFDFALAAGPATPARDLAAFAQWCRANPQRANISVPIAGGTLELLVGMLGQSARFDPTVVPYKGGGGDFRTDLMGGRVPAGFALASEFLPDHQSGRLRILATTGSSRSSLLPGVPTFAEQGHPELTAREWFGFVGPARLDAATEQRVAAALQTALRAPTVQATYAKLGLEPTVVTGREFKDEIRAEYARWRDVVKAVNYQPID